jgi:hypothetical protein
MINIILKLIYSSEELSFYTTENKRASNNYLSNLKVGKYLRNAIPILACKQLGSRLDDYII